jgi:hypothetical protein
LIESINCTSCISKNCYAAALDDAVLDLSPQGISDWASDIAACKTTGTYWNTDVELFAGFMCNQAGTGIEIAIFLDNACSIYSSLQSYKKIVAGTNDETYVTSSATVVTYPFLHDLPCSEVAFINPYSNDDNQEAADRVIDACKNIFKNGAMLVSDCNADGAKDDGANANADEVADADYSWFKYMVSQNDLADAASVCYVVQALEGEYSAAHTYNGNEKNGSGQSYNYSQKSGKSAGKIFGIVLLVVVLVGAIAYGFVAMKKKKDTKKQPLVSKNNGAMA